VCFPLVAASLAKFSSVFFFSFFPFLLLKLCSRCARERVISRSDPIAHAVFLSHQGLQTCWSRPPLLPDQEAMLSFPLGLFLSSFSFPFRHIRASTENNRRPLPPLKSCLLLGTPLLSLAQRWRLHFFSSYIAGTPRMSTARLSLLSGAMKRGFPLFSLRVPAQVSLMFSPSPPSFLHENEHVV